MDQQKDQQNQNQNQVKINDYSQLYAKNPVYPDHTKHSNTPDYSAYFHAPSNLGHPDNPGKLNVPINYQDAPKPAQPFSPIPLLLIAGVLFLFMGGILFLSSTWDMLPEALRAISLLSASLIAFGVNILAEKVLKLPKTGLAFYILGCIFLPLALIGIGGFQLFGEWLSFSGDGCSLLWAMIFASIAGTTFLGQRNYKQVFLAGISLTSVTITWFFLMEFLGEILFESESIGYFVFLSTGLALQAIAMAILEKFCRSHPIIARAFPVSLYLTNLFYAVVFLIVSEDFPKIGIFFSLILFVLFWNSAFISRKFHTGIFGACLMLHVAVSTIVNTWFNSEIIGTKEIYFTFGYMAMILLAFHKIPKLRTELTETFSKAGAIVSIPFFLGSIFYHLSENYEILLVYILVAIGFVLYQKYSYKLTENRIYFILECGILFFAAISSEQYQIASFLLVCSALVLLIQAFLRKNTGSLVLAIAASAGMILSGYAHPEITILFLGAGLSIGGAVYAHRTQRELLEICCSWTGIALLIPASMKLCSFWMESSTASVVSLMLLLTCYLLEIFAFPGHARSQKMKSYHEAVSLVISHVVIFGYLETQRAVTVGTGMLFCIGLLIFSAGFLKKNFNAWAIPQLVMLYFVYSDMMQSLTYSMMTQVISYLVLLFIYVAMGRIILPDGFYRSDASGIRIDWALLAGIFPIIGIAMTILWHPAIVICLLLAIYSVLYIHRVNNNRIPAVMASEFACLAFLIHNIEDPFGMIALFSGENNQIPGVLGILLPGHLFILSLLWILPAESRNRIHIIRFGMYCITMICMLMTNLYSESVTDSIFIAVISFVILSGSFTVKKLRWFTLGFASLILTTIRVTWKFWTSLHWGVYLFFAGIVLIVTASLYEYFTRRAQEHPENSEQKRKPFSSWTW
ncbi:MAG: DUF2157 domain-containing protein [Oscillospiraceae bacterium]|nr:DUF2157 domain-containing protein [Oscillospiraceae bacterium]